MPRRAPSSCEQTLLVYLNEPWSMADGGQLRLYHTDGSTTDVDPILDRVVVFLSKTMPHEVLAAHSERWAISVWYHGAEEQRDGGCDDENLTTYSFGRTAEEVEAFLLALTAFNEDGTSRAPLESSPDEPTSESRAKARTFDASLLSTW